MTEPCDLAELTCRVLEDWAFLLPERCADALPRLAQELQRLHAAVTFDGVSDGRVEVVTTPRLIGELLTNLLGPGEHLADAAALRDAVGELVNVLGAQLLDARWGSRASYASLPAVRLCGGDEPFLPPAGSEALGFCIGGEPLAILLQSPLPA